MEIHINRLTDNLAYEQTFLQIAHEARWLNDKEFVRYEQAITALKAFHERVKAVKGAVFEV